MLLKSQRYGYQADIIQVKQAKGDRCCLTGRGHILGELKSLDLRFRERGERKVGEKIVINERHPLSLPHLPDAYIGIMKTRNEGENCCKIDTWGQDGL